MNRTTSLLFVLGMALFGLESGASPEKWEKEIAAIEAREGLKEPKSGTIVFAGSSSIRMWRTLLRDMAPLKVMNRGFGGSTIADCNYFAPRIITRYKPSLLVFYAGDNDVAAGNTPEQVLADYKKFVATVRRDLPETPILFLAIKPSPARWNLWETAQKANRLVQEYSKGQKGLEYIDVASPMLDKGGRVRNDLFLSDRLHMNAQGYVIWTDTIKPRLLELHKSLSK